MESEDWSSILDGFARCVRITRNQKEAFKVNEKLFVKPVPSINTFFDKVLVMSEDKKVKENRLGLLQSIASLSNGLADLSKLERF